MVKEILAVSLREFHISGAGQGETDYQGIERLRNRPFSLATSFQKSALKAGATGTHGAAGRLAQRLVDERASLQINFLSLHHFKQ